MALSLLLPDSYACSYSQEQYHTHTSSTLTVISLIFEEHSLKILLLCIYQWYACGNIPEFQFLYEFVERKQLAELSYCIFLYTVKKNKILRPTETTNDIRLMGFERFCYFKARKQWCCPCLVRSHTYNS